MLRTFTLSAIIKAKATSCCFHRLSYGIVRELSDVATGSADSSGITIKQRRESLGEADQYFGHTRCLGRVALAPSNQSSVNLVDSTEIPIRRTRAIPQGAVMFDRAL